MRELGVFQLCFSNLMTRKNNFGAVAWPVPLLRKEKCLGASADWAWGPGGTDGRPRSAACPGLQVPRVWL